MRTVMTLKTYDYNSKAEYRNHKAEMEKKGYKLCESNFNGMFDMQIVTDLEDDRVITASYYKEEI